MISDRIARSQIILSGPAIDQTGAGWAIAERSMQVALELASIVHEGQVDKADEPIINHVARVVDAVSKQVRGMEYRDRAIAVSAAWLHDTVEDGDVDIWAIDHVFPAGVGIIVRLLTRNPEDTYAEYISKIAKADASISYYDTARLIKRADLFDNRFRGKLPASMEQRYDRALEVLGRNDWRGR